MCRSFILSIALVFAFLCSSIGAHIQAQQLTYTSSFTELLQQHGLEYYEPVEEWLHVAGQKDDDFMKYDLILENDYNDFEIRYRIRGKEPADITLPPNIEVTRLLASIATNEESADIHVTVANDTYALETFNAEKAVFASFIPKEDFSSKPFGSLVSLYSDEFGAVDVILLYFDHNYDPVQSYRNLRFK